MRKLSSLPARLVRRLLAVAEDFEIGAPAKLRRRFPDCYTTVRALHCLAPENLKVLYDIGANTGSWTRTFSTFFPELAHAILFEPAEERRSQLTSLALRRVKIEHAPIALGRIGGEAMLQGGGASASLLPATALQNHFFPGSINVEARQTVPVAALDEWVARSGAPSPDIIKIDVQGAEGEVLAGGEATVARSRWLVIELSTVPLYAGQQRSGATLDWLEQHGWRMAGIGHQWRNLQGELLQFDAILTRCDVR